MQYVICKVLFLIELFKARCDQVLTLILLSSWASIHYPRLSEFKTKEVQPNLRIILEVWTGGLVLLLSTAIFTSLLLSELTLSCPLSLTLH